MKLVNAEYTQVHFTLLVNMYILCILLYDVKINNLKFASVFWTVSFHALDHITNSWISKVQE